jgi:hypothetical protein
MPQQQENAQQSWKDKFNTALFLMVVHQRAIIIVTRTGFGKDAFGLTTLFTFGLMCLWAAFSKDVFMWVWVAAWVVCVIRHRISAAMLAGKGVMVHSEDDGWPQEAIWLGCTVGTAKLIVEPAVVGLLGIMLFWMYQEKGLSVYGLPYFLLAGVVTLPFIEMVRQRIWDRRLQGMQNARLEQEALMREQRKRYGN